MQQATHLYQLSVGIAVKAARIAYGELIAAWQGKAQTVSVQTLVPAVVLAIGFLVLTLVLIEVAVRWCCCSGASSPTAASRKVLPSPQAAPKADSSTGGDIPLSRMEPGKVLACRVCAVDLRAQGAGDKPASELVALHAEGKRHKKAAALSTAPPRSLVGWLSLEEFRAVQRRVHGAAGGATETPGAAADRAALASAGESKHGGGDDSDGELSAAPAANARPAESGVNAFRSVGGRNVAVVFEQLGISHGAGSGLSAADAAWVSVGAAKKRGGVAGAGAEAAPPKVRTTSSMMHMEGSTNILEGLTLWPKFATPRQEAELLAFVDRSLAEGQAGRLRGQAYRSSRGRDAATLHYGCFVDPSTGAADPSKQVEALPLVLQQMAQRIVSMGGEELALPQGFTAARINCATVYVMEKGMHMQPSLLDAGAFGQPLFLLALAGGDEHMLSLGRRIEAAEGAPAGTYNSSISMRLPRRQLLCLRGTVAEAVRHCVPTTGDRLILIALRTAAPGLIDELAARGNLRD
jgi:hypothetical protein